MTGSLVATSLWDVDSILHTAIALKAHLRMTFTISMLMFVFVFIIVVVVIFLFLLIAILLRLSRSACNSRTAHIAVFF